MSDYARQVRKVIEEELTKIIKEERAKARREPTPEVQRYQLVGKKPTNKFLARQNKPKETTDDD